MTTTAITTADRNAIITAAVRGLVAADLLVTVGVRGVEGLSLVNSTDADAITATATSGQGVSILTCDRAGELGPAVWFTEGNGSPASIVVDAIPAESPAFAAMWETIERMS